MANYLVNGLYPVNYFDLVNVNKIEYPNQQWWASKERFAYTKPNKRWEYLSRADGGIQNSEYLEIDLGRVREINFLEFNVIKMPIDISIDFDALSDADGNHVWVPIQPTSSNTFDDYVEYSPTRNSWQKSNFYFTDTLGKIVKTRFLRIKYARRDVTWPAKNARPFRWPVIVKDLRIARSVFDHKDTLGPIFSSKVDSTNVAIVPRVEADLTTKEVRQRFSIQESDQRGAIIPDLLGFGFLTNVSIIPDSEISDIERLRKWEWQLLDVTDPLQPSVVVGSGIHTEAIHSGDKVWVDVHFTLPIRPTIGNIYELRLKSLNSVTSNTFYANSPNTVPGVDIPGEFNFTYGTTVIPYAAAGSETPLDFVAIGNYIQKTDGYEGTFEIVGVSASDVTIAQPYTGFTNTDAKAIRIFPVRKYNVDVRTWQATTGYVLGEFVLPTVSDGHIYRVITAGTTSGTEPAFDTTTDSLTADGSVVFQEANSLSGEYKPEATQSLTMRLWGDVADTGQDILGNKYRYGTRRDSADLVFDETNAGWLSAPQPSPSAVESLYFDVRTENTISGLLDASELDAIRIAARTHGVWMHVYYTNDMVRSKKPTTQAEWDAIVWTPLNQTYNVTGNSVYQLPHKIKTSFIKLEFSNLKPLPFHIPTNPELPEVKYRRYPTWVESTFTVDQLRPTIEDWFVRKSTRRERKILQRLRKKYDNNQIEFDYKQRIFLSALAGGSKRLIKDKKVRSSGLVDIKNRAIIDNTTAGKIYFRTNKFFRNHLQVTVDQSNILGEMIASRFDYKDHRNTVESKSNRKFRPPVVEVSTKGNRISESYGELLNTPMWFNTKCIHQYREETAKFNKKAYFVGIREVEFLRNDYTIVHDDELIDDILHDGQFLESNSFVPLTDTTIIDGQTVYVSYTIEATESTPVINIKDEAVALNGFTPIRLEQEGGPAINKRIFSQPNQSGLEYELGEDYDFAYKTSEAGFTLNYIARSDNHNRLGVPSVSTTGFIREDAYIVTGRGTPGEELANEDEGTVTGVGTAVSITGLYGTGVYGKDGGTYNILDPPDNPGPGNLYVD